MTAPLLNALLPGQHLRLLLCVGTGGVGKTTLSAALAVRAALLGRRVVVVTIDPARRLAQAMGLDGLVHEPTPVHVPGANGSLDAMMLDVRHAFDQALIGQVSVEEADRIRANPFYRALAETFSGTQEYVAMEKIGELHRLAAGDGRWDLIVVDTPPSASALDFLDGPNRLEALAHNPLLRVVLGLPRAVRVPGRGRGAGQPGPGHDPRRTAVRDLRTFLQVFERAVLSFESHAVETRRLLASERPRSWRWRAPRPAPVAEAGALVHRRWRGGYRYRGCDQSDHPVVDMPPDRWQGRHGRGRRTTYRFWPSPPEPGEGAAERQAIEPLTRLRVPTTLIARQPDRSQRRRIIEPLCLAASSSSRRHDVISACWRSRSTALTFGHATPHAPLDAVVQRFCETFGAHRGSPRKWFAHASGRLRRETDRHACPDTWPALASCPSP